MTDTTLKGDKQGEQPMTEITKEPTQADPLDGFNIDIDFEQMAEITHVNLALDASYRCTRCDAQAYVEVQLRPTATMPEPMDLYFCKHHYNRHADKLVTVAQKIVDHTGWLENQERAYKGQPVL